MADSPATARDDAIELLLVLSHVVQAHHLGEHDVVDRLLSQMTPAAVRRVTRLLRDARAEHALGHDDRPLAQVIDLMPRA